MALIAKNKQHGHQIEAGTRGRLRGHMFEEQVSAELNRLDLSQTDHMVKLTDRNIYQGNPAAALVEHISADRKRQIARLKAYWLGGLATIGQGDELNNDRGETINGSKSDIVMDVTYQDGKKEYVGISVKSCRNNAQVALTTSGAFCEMLRGNDIPVSKDAETGMKMFCGEAGYRPGDGFMPEDVSNIASPRTARPERWYWEELPSQAQEEWKHLLTVYQDKITILILQKANAYRTDRFSPSYILHECRQHTDINDCQTAVMSVYELAEYSRLFDGFGLTRKRILKGKYKGIDLAEHLYPHFGFLQFQPIGNKQNFSELQFNLKSNYYKTFGKLKQKEIRPGDALP